MNLIRKGRRAGGAGRAGEAGKRAGEAERQERRKGRRGGGKVGGRERQEGQEGRDRRQRGRKSRRGGKGRAGPGGYTPGMRNSLTRLILLTALVGVAGTVNGEVTRVDIARRTDVGTSGYEKIVGTIHFAVDPSDPRNSVIVDLDKARRRTRPDAWNSRPTVHPAPAGAARSNGVALVEVSNRGRKGMFSGFNRGGDARPVEGRRSRRRLPDAAGLHARLGRLAVRRARGRRPDEARCAGRRGRQRRSCARSSRRTSASPKRRWPISPDIAGRSSERPTRRSRFATARSAMPHESRAADGRCKGNTVTTDGGFEPGRTYRARVSGGESAGRRRRAWRRSATRRRG